MDATHNENLGSVVVWASPGLFALCLWFVARFVKKHDDFHEKVVKRFEEISHSIEKTEKSVALSVAVISKEAIELKTANLEFQSKINDHLLRLHQNTAELGAKLEGSFLAIEGHQVAIEGIREEALETRNMMSKVVEIAKNVFRVSEEAKKK